MTPAEMCVFYPDIEGTVTGPKLKAAVKGLDYVNVRADARLQLHFHTEITSEEGKKIALFANGVVAPKPDRRSLSSGRT